jgi:hypothetical protein
VEGGDALDDVGAKRGIGERFVGARQALDKQKLYRAG